MREEKKPIQMGVIKLKLGLTQMKLNCELIIKCAMM